MVEIYVAVGISTILLILLHLVFELESLDVVKSWPLILMSSSSQHHFSGDFEILQRMICGRVWRARGRASGPSVTQYLTGIYQSLLNCLVHIGINILTYYYLPLRVPSRGLTHAISSFNNNKFISIHNIH